MPDVSYWGPLFPDLAAASYIKPAVPAGLALEEPVTFSGALDSATVRARAAGSVGNTITVQFSADALTDQGELDEDVLAKTILIKFVSEGTTVQDVANLFAVSELAELVGTLDASAFLVGGEDEFGPTNLAGGVDPETTTVSYWGPLFPDVSTSDDDPSLIVGFGDPGAAQFALSLESGFEIDYEWITDVFKSYDGSERRAGILSLPRQTYRGAAYLVGDRVLAVRAQVERFAALGSTFLLGLPHDEATILEDASGLVVPCATALLDWAIPGQRVAVLASNESAVLAVIQSVAADALTLDVDPGDNGAAGGAIVPLVPVALDAQQGFARHPVPRGEAQGTVECWQVRARATTFGYHSSDTPASLSLATRSAAMPAGVLAAKTPGTAGNAIAVTFVADSVGGVELDEGGNDVVIHFEDAVSTVQDVSDALDGSVLVALTGPIDFDQVLVQTDDEFGPANLAGGTAGAVAEVGRGATLNTYLSRPIFDRGVDVDGTADDSVQAMSDVVDLGGAPVPVGSASEPDWGRRIAIARSDPAEHQWLMRFLHAIFGRWKTFWLPTHRADLVAVGDGPGNGGGSGELLIDSTIGDFTAWFPKRNHIQVLQESGTYNLLVEGYQDNGDGTITLEILAESPGIVPAAEPIDMISWLELCRLESDKVTVRHRSGMFAMAESARAVQR